MPQSTGKKLEPMHPSCHIAAQHVVVYVCVVVGVQKRKIKVDVLPQIHMNI